VILVTTMWENVDPSTGRGRKKQLEKQWHDMALRYGSWVAEHDGTKESAMNILELL